MARAKGIRKVLVIGSGPIVIGQAAEFDYSGTQACRALREEGVEVVLVNPNPATIMTDRDTADRVYLEPLTLSSIKQIIEKEKPQGLIATMGGQAGLNLAVEMHDSGILASLGVRLLGTGVETIKKGEDREAFKEAMARLGQPTPTSIAVTSLDQMDAVLRDVGLPCVIRPAFTLGGTGGGIATTYAQLEDSLLKGLAASPAGQVLVESSLYGEKEIEFEVIRDSSGNSIAVCSMENMDPMGIHTGDSIVVAPALTLDDRLYQRLRRAALDIAGGLDIRGACNVQMAVRRSTGEYFVIEVNPRVSRSSALASKATGYPIARVAAKIALGLNLDEIINEVTRKTTAAYEPTIDYVAVKIPRWPWDKFHGGTRDLGLQMKSTGEVMAIGRTLEEALGKGISSLDLKESLWVPGAPEIPREEIISHLKNPDHSRLFWVMRALHQGILPEEVSEITGIDAFFVDRINRVCEVERQLVQWRDRPKVALSYPGLMARCKTSGLSDSRMAGLLGSSEEAVRKAREAFGLKPVYKMVDTCAGEFQAATPYYYSTYEESTETQKRRKSSRRESVLVLGSGPIRIGQGVEFDYCAVHAAWALEKEGFSSVIVNNNPETVSTDFNTASRLYFEPLTFEHVMSVIEVERPLGVLVGFGGQTAINLVDALSKAGVRVLGTNPQAIHITEERGEFIKLLHDLGIPAIPGSIAKNEEEALRICSILGFPVVVRPSYVLGGRGMAIVYDEEELLGYFREALATVNDHDILIDKYVLATEVEVDVVSDGTSIHIPALLEHVERSGVHSGDSIAQIPARRLSPAATKKIVDYSLALSKALPIRGIANIQYIVDGDTVYCLEVNPRASRTVPFVTKVTGFPVVPVATGLSLGRSLKSYGVLNPLGTLPPLHAVKMPVFSWSKIMVDPVLGPEMKSTGEVMGIGHDLDEAMLKAFVAQGLKEEMVMSAAITVADRDKPMCVELARLLQASGWRLYATKGTAAYLGERGISCEVVRKVSQELGPEKEPLLSDLISRNRVGIIVNTFTRGQIVERDGFKIRALAIRKGIPVFTCLETAMSFARAATKYGHMQALALQDVSQYLS